VILKATTDVLYIDVFFAIFKIKEIIMDISDIISIFLGILSICLAIIIP